MRLFELFLGSQNITTLCLNQLWNYGKKLNNPMDTDMNKLEWAEPHFPLILQKLLGPKIVGP